MTSRTAVLAGATGLVGSRLLARLLADPDYARVIAITRRDPGVTHEKLAVRVVDFDALTGDAVAAPVDDAYCALGTTIGKAGSREAFRRVDVGHVTRFAQAARDAGATRFLLVSATGAHKDSRFFYNRAKAEAEDAVAAAGFPVVHVYRPSLLLGERHESRPAERAGILLARVTRPALPSSWARRVATDADALAASMLAAAKSDATGVTVHEAADVR